MKRLTVGNMELIRSDCRRLAPSYYLPQTDALEALETGTGNCFAKAMIACGIVVLRHNIEPSVAYSARLHGTEKPSAKPLDPRSKKNMSHISMVVPGVSDAGVERVVGIHFGVNVKNMTQPRTPAERYTAQEDEVAIHEDFNEKDDYVLAKPNGEIVASPNGHELGVVAGHWQRLGQAYLAAIDRPPLDYDMLLDQLVSHQAISLPTRLHPAS